MSSVGDTHLLSQLKAGQRDAARLVWQRYYRRLLGLARQKLAGLRAVADEEDVALSAFDSFCRGAEQGRFAELEDREDLWQLLAVIIARKAADLRQHAARLKRSGGRVNEGPEALGGVAVRGPVPDEEAEAAEQCEWLLAALPDEDLRAVALGKLAGHTNAELAEALGWSVAWVERKLARVRGIWGRLLREDS